jgi:hypothetical protein
MTIRANRQGDKTNADANSGHRDHHTSKTFRNLSTGRRRHPHRKRIIVDQRVAKMAPPHLVLKLALVGLARKRRSY